MADHAARIGELKHALEQVGHATTERTREIAAVLRLARTALPGVDLPSGVAGDAANGIAAALRALADMDATIRSIIREVHACAR